MEMIIIALLLIIILTDDIRTFHRLEIDDATIEAMLGANYFPPLLLLRVQIVFRSSLACH